MSQGESFRSRDGVREPPPALRWRSWPIVDERPWPFHAGPTWPPPSESLTAWMPYLLLSFAGLVIGWATANLLAALAAAAAVLACLWRWLIPAEYEANSQGLTVLIGGRRSRIPWGSVGGYEVHANGLSFFPRRTFLGRARGLYVPIDPERRLPEVARYYLEPWL